MFNPMNQALPSTDDEVTEALRYKHPTFMGITLASLHDCYRAQGKSIDETYELVRNEQLKMLEKSLQQYKKTEPEKCPHCGSQEFRDEDYLNPCSLAGCRLNGPPGTTYHLNCGSQTREYCIKCGELLFDSACEEVEWIEIRYRCSSCQSEASGVQTGHFACGTSFWIPKFPTCILPT